MLELDGSFGEGGGQILRTSLALSLITRTPFRITNIRANRSKPGLRRQHVTAVRAAARVGDAEIKGDAVNSTELVFRPGPVKGGDYEFDIGTAGSTTLVFQAVLPALLTAPQSSTLTLTGGTHNHGGPPWDFLQTVFLPVLGRMGARVSGRLDRHGFAPAGGGRWTARIEPSRLMPLHLNTRGERVAGSVRALVSNLPVSIADRELDVIRKQLDWPASAFRAQSVDADGPGNIVMIGGSWTNTAELATGFGQRGVPAEHVAREALRCWLDYERSDVPVGEHLADQLLLPLALAGGGSFRTLRPTPHTTTNAETIARFLPIRFRTERQPGGTWMIAL